MHRDVVLTVIIQPQNLSAIGKACLLAKCLPNVRMRKEKVLIIPLHENTRTLNSNCFRIFLPRGTAYLMFAQDGRAEKCTGMPEAHAKLLY